MPSILTQILHIKAQFPNHPIKTLRVNNAREFISKSFNDFFISLAIDIQYPVPHVHFRNGLAEGVIKQLQLIARPLLM